MRMFAVVFVVAKQNKYQLYRNILNDQYKL